LEPPPRTQDRPKFHLKIRCHFALQSGSTWVSFQEPFRLQKADQNQSKNQSDFRLNFWSILGPKRLPKWRSKSEPGASKPTPKSLQDPSDTYPGPQGSDQDPEGAHHIDFWPVFGSILGALQGVKMEPLGVLWERFFIGLRGLFHGSTVAPVFNSQHDRVFASS